MDKKPDGGQAFPGAFNLDEDKGMSLRDWFAGQAMNGLLSDAQSMAALHQHFGEKTTEPIAMACYQFADAMLAAREK